MMIRRITVLSILWLIASGSWAQQLPAYQLFNQKGKPTSYAKMLRTLAKADVVLFGELHNNPICHWLELQLLRDLHQEHDSLVLAMEMFEADNQLVLDEYLLGTIQEKHLLNEAKVWNNYATDYQPLIEFAKANDIPVVASNVPRRYANLVYRQGLAALDSLSDQAKQWVAPLPITVDMQLSSYQEMLAMMGGSSHGGDTGEAETLVHAQAVKDATMAHFVLQQLPRPVFHVNGSYHSQDKEGIAWYLRQAQPDLIIMNIHSVEQDTIDELVEENQTDADFTICIPSDMTKTY
ncbi:ChaN family lipoprotein [Tunicatimonas pelagia]|uniref:ChaN family lipoprotein n=1 Tax=Tunicatimonas pelagia TaxID=931531 RepID=UPI0026665E97|nr:ChaN family lipoprotein [Tunicatimonas pelagia]WKN43022.1 ChaN family lipoprotein [Tunicatimonas pelagia]